MTTSVDTSHCRHHPFRLSSRAISSTVGHSCTRSALFVVSGVSADGKSAWLTCSTAGGRGPFRF
jgi:hypothetical protein